MFDDDNISFIDEISKPKRRYNRFSGRQITYLVPPKGLARTCPQCGTDERHINIMNADSNCMGVTCSFCQHEFDVVKRVVPKKR